MNIERIVPVIERKSYPLIDQAVKRALQEARFQQFRRERAAKKNSGDVAEPG